MVSEPVFNMSPPNEDFNTESWDGWLNNVYNDKHQPINIAAIPNTSLPITDVWDGVVLSLLLRRDKRLSSILTDLQGSRWSLLYRSKLRAHLLNFFSNQYHQHIYNRDLELAGEFFLNHPGYKGIFVAFDGQVLTREDILPTTNGVSIVGTLASLTDYIGTEKIRLGKKVFESNIKYISEWCMSNFSYHREKWCYAKDVLPIKLEEVKLEPEELEEERKKYVPTKQERLQEKLNAMTPEQRRDFFIMKKLERKAIVLKNKFGKDIEIEDILEC